jgi:hypothetical protein
MAKTYEKVIFVPSGDTASMSNALSMCAKLKSMAKIQAYKPADNGIGLEVSLMPEGAGATVPHQDGARWNPEAKPDYAWYRGYITSRLRTSGFVELGANEPEPVEEVAPASAESVVLDSASDEV